MIVPFDYESILENTGTVLVMHGVDDDVVDVEEGRKISAGFSEAVASASPGNVAVWARAGASEAGGLKFQYKEIEEGLVGHGMAKTAPLVLEMALALIPEGDYTEM